MVAVGGIVGMIIVVSLLLWEKNHSVQKRRVGYYNTKPSQIQKKILKNPCNTTDGDQDKTEELYFCYQNNSTQAVFTFDNTLKIGGYGLDSWEDYDWYLDCSGMKQSGHWWGNVFTTTGKWSEGSFGFSSNSKKWKKQVSLTKTNRKIMLNINTTQIPFGQPDSFSEHQNPPCHGLALCIWRPHAQDPCTTLLLCPNVTMTNTTLSLTPPDITPGPKSSSPVKPKIYIKPETDDWFKITTGVSRIDNNWLLMVEQAAKASGADCVVCMGARPLLQVVPSALGLDCLVDVMNKTIPSENCSSWDKIYPLTTAEKQKPLFSKKVAVGNFTCINRTGAGVRLGKLNDTQCYSVETVNMAFKPKARSDIWWWCGDDRLFDRLPYNTTGFCASVSLILPVSITPLTVTDLLTTVNVVYPHTWKSRPKRSVMSDDPTYIDSIGIPRGVPTEYKLINQVAAGFESSLCWWCTINKNVDRINYIHYNVQKLGNKTEEGFSAIHEQLSATSLMAFQNRIAVDMLLAEKGGVCSIFGDQCCTFIPNNTAADGSLTKALEGFRSLNSKMKDHSGVDTSMWDGFGDMFGKYKQLVFSILTSIAVFTAILTLCGCCCIPCIRALCTRVITTAIQPVKTEMSEMYALLTLDGDLQTNSDDDDDDDDDDEKLEASDETSLHFPDLFPDPGDYATNL
ncbi:uncharacterized protein LOC123480998 [Coregonus clupeaformis]|uniref:uncharacterized protein LOC123480998 n=1 Tax=Coregonus clupeaformis TaxID=59861 RepID=UPI001E1C517A|nr:uncharacterized protein LOC123480998 [Coregonus clupeaformis]